MNIFESSTDILGRLETAHLKRATEEFFQTARSIRKRLGKQAYLLDKYLIDLLNAINETLAQDAAVSGFDAYSDLLHLLRKVSDKDENIKEHPLYPKVEEFIDGNPLIFQDKVTNTDYCLVHLFDDFLGCTAPKQFEEWEHNIKSKIDIQYSCELYHKICEAVGDEEQMEILNTLIRQRFLITPAMDMFAQGLTNGLLYALTSRDVETNKPILQLVLEEMT